MHLCVLKLAKMLKKMKVLKSKLMITARIGMKMTPTLDTIELIVPFIAHVLNFKRH